jgi:hypothetical protein
MQFVYINVILECPEVQQSNLPILVTIILFISILVQFFFQVIRSYIFVDVFFSINRIYLVILNNKLSSVFSIEFIYPNKT